MRFSLLSQEILLIFSQETMKDKLAQIGFYTLEDFRARYCSETSPLWRCELLLTDRCNFHCPYCRGIRSEFQGGLSYEKAQEIVALWSSMGLKNIRFSGGEPTLWPDLLKLVVFTKQQGIQRIALSTNGSADFSFYQDLVQAGVDDFSISLDACCAATGEAMSGYAGIWNKIIKNIEGLSALTYVTVGVVLTKRNIPEVPDIIMFALNLGVSDIRLITAAQTNPYLPKILWIDLQNYPILLYRLKNLISGRPVRSLSQDDTSSCPLVLDDMAVIHDYHFPCIIYLREGGDPIGKVSPDMRAERRYWFESHDCFQDEICRKNCLDVCVDYNNRVFELNEKFKEK